jgi:mono/diheme cytochrome c family protein
MKSTLRAFVVLVAIVTIVGTAIAYTIIRRGLSTRAEPSRAEQAVARTLRSLATPRAVRSQPNPVPASDEVLADALEHFADHCALCHANDGSGDTTIGRGLYPKAPDLRLAATQSLSDGELFSIIENGVRLTGMPAWGTGTPEGERESWSLVRFIRHLPALTPEELDRMEALNPKTPGELREQEETRRFLEGDTKKPPTKPSGQKDHHK